MVPVPPTGGCAGSRNAPPARRGTRRRWTAVRSQVVAADVRRLGAAQLALVPAGAPMARRRALLAAYDDVLVEAARDAGGAARAAAPTPEGAARDLERLRLLAALEAAGLAVRDLTVRTPALLRRRPAGGGARRPRRGARTAARRCPARPRWTRPERWHLTLLFLGDRAARGASARWWPRPGPAVAAAPPMTLRLAGAGRFGSLRRPQVAWAGLDGDVAPLIALAGRLAAPPARLGLPVEDRPFRPHLTLGRWRPGRPADGTLTDRLAGYRGPAWPVGEVLLLESHLGPRPVHEVVAAWPVG